MAADLTTIQRVEAGWRPITDGSQDETLATTLIGAASRLLRHLVPSVDSRVAAGTLDGDLVSDQVAAAVIRVLRNPDGVREVSVDDYREVRDRDVSSGALQFLDSELDLLRPDEDTGGAFTIRPAGRPTAGWWPPGGLGPPW